MNARHAPLSTGSAIGPPSVAPEVAFDTIGGTWRARFRAMASPCEVLIDGGARSQARRLAERIAAEAQRIETRYSRYRDDSAVQRINTAAGEPIDVDAELAGLLDFAAECHAASDGAFDITSGVLRRAWRFDGGTDAPSQAEIDALRPLVGWHRAGWHSPTLCLPVGMQIDLGGIGKEYAVDRALDIACEHGDRAVLVNFGGDLHASGPPANGAWRVGIEAVRAGEPATRTIELQRGALATSGDAQRYVLAGGVRHGHVLDARTGWPARSAPRSVTVAADTCTQAGMLATLAMLQGRHAERWLQAQVPGWWCER